MSTNNNNNSEVQHNKTLTTVTGATTTVSTLKITQHSHAIDKDEIVTADFQVQELNSGSAQSLNSGGQAGVSDQMQEDWPEMASEESGGKASQGASKKVSVTKGIQQQVGVIGQEGRTGQVKESVGSAGSAQMFSEEGAGSGSGANWPDMNAREDDAGKGQQDEEEIKESVVADTIQEGGLP